MGASVVASGTSCTQAGGGRKVRKRRGLRRLCEQSWQRLWPGIAGAKHAQSAQHNRNKAADCCRGESVQMESPCMMHAHCMQLCRDRSHTVPVFGVAFQAFRMVVCRLLSPTVQGHSNDVAVQQAAPDAPVQFRHLTAQSSEGSHVPALPAGEPGRGQQLWRSLGESQQPAHDPPAQCLTCALLPLRCRLKVLESAASHMINAMQRDRLGATEHNNKG